MTASSGQARQLDPATGQRGSMRWISGALLSKASAVSDYNVSSRRERNAATFDDEAGYGVLPSIANLLAVSAGSNRVAMRSYGQDVLSYHITVSSGAVSVFAASPMLLTPLAGVGLCSTASSALLFDVWHQDIRKQDPRSSEVEALRVRIAGFQALDPDWAGDDTVLVSDQIARVAETIIDAVAQAGLPLPNPSPSAEGEVGLSWFRGRDRLALSVLTDMHIVWATSINRHVEEGEDIEVESGSFPGSIIEALRGFYGQASGPLLLRG